MGPSPRWVTCRKRLETWDLDEPIVAVTLARMKLREVPRFLRWGRPLNG